MVSKVKANIIAAGHTHAQMLRPHRDLTLVNPGSVGMRVMRVADRSRFLARAEYAVLDWSKETFRVEFHRLQVELAELARAARNSGMPHAEWWLTKWT
jgi:predicted phosphodiesterase